MKPVNVSDYWFLNNWQGVVGDPYKILIEFSSELGKNFDDDDLDLFK